MEILVSNLVQENSDIFGSIFGFIIYYYKLLEKGELYRVSKHIWDHDILCQHLLNCRSLEGKYIPGVITLFSHWNCYSTSLFHESNNYYSVYISVPLFEKSKLQQNSFDINILLKILRAMLNIQNDWIQPGLHSKYGWSGFYFLIDKGWVDDKR